MIIGAAFLILAGLLACGMLISSALLKIADAQHGVADAIKRFARAESAKSPNPFGPMTM